MMNLELSKYVIKTLVADRRKKERTKELEKNLKELLKLTYATANVAIVRLKSEWLCDVLVI